MRLAKIKNVRCGEPEASTYVVLPEGLINDEFQERVYRAAEAYKAVMDETPVRHHEWGPTLGPMQLREMDPERTVGAVLRELDEEAERRKAVQREAEKRNRSFGHYLEEEGLIIVQLAEHDFEARVDWGHRHGTLIRYDGLSYFVHDPWDEVEGNEKEHE